MKRRDSFRLGGSSEEDALLRMTALMCLIAGLIIWSYHGESIAWRLGHMAVACCDTRKFADRVMLNYKGNKWRRR